MKINSPVVYLICVSIAAIFFSRSSIAEDDAATVAQSFLAHVSQLDGLTSDQQTAIRAVFDEFLEDAPADAITESLIAIHDGYAEAVESSDGKNITEAIRRLAPFAESTDNFLASDASFYLGRSLMNNENFEAALPLLQRVYGPLADFNAHVGHARFYAGVAQAGLLQYGEAIQSLTDFLQFYPEAPERLRVAAWRQVQQLQSIKEGQLEDVYQRMDFSRRRLSQFMPGEVTQQQQEKIVNMLARLIKEQEKKEASSSSKDQQKKKQQQQQQQQQASKDKQQGKSQTGGKSNNPNGQVVEKSYDDGPASPWSRLRDRSRDPANNAIKDKLPARYRDIVERYYEAANGDANK